MIRQSTRIISTLSSLSGIGVAAAVLLAACGGNDTILLAGAEEGTEALAITSLELTASLPQCRKESRGQVYYVMQDDQFYYCDGTRLRDIDLDCDPSGLVDVVAANTHACPRGGSLIRTGLDKNHDGKLKSSESTSTHTLCNGARGATGPRGPQGVAGLAGAIGADGSSCNVHDNGDHTKTITCGESSVTVVDGTDGVDGSCSVTDMPVAPPAPAQHVISCDDGSSAIIEDGRDGIDGTNGTNAPYVVVVALEAADPNVCANGGVAIASGLDDGRDANGVGLNAVAGDGILQSEEQESWQSACNGAPGAEGPPGAPPPDTFPPVVLPIEWSSENDTLIIGALNTFSVAAFDNQGAVSCSIRLDNAYVHFSTPMSIVAGTAMASFFLYHEPWELQGGTVSVTCSDAAGNATSVTRNWVGTHWSNLGDSQVPLLGPISPSAAQVNVPVTFSFAYSDAVGVVACDLTLWDSLNNYQYFRFPLYASTSGTLIQTFAIPSNGGFLAAGSGMVRADGGCHDASGNYGHTTAMITVAPAVP